MINKSVDVLIMGAGLSGLIAAAKAAEQGKKVLLVAKGMGALGLTSGCIDVWGYSLEQPEQVCQQPVEEIRRLVAVNPAHPYTKVQDVLAESLNYFQEICKSSGYPYLDNNGGNWQLPTALGTLRPTYLAPASMALGNLSDVKEILVVGFSELKDFYPDVLATNLKKNANLHPACKLVTKVASAGGGELSPNTIARRLENPDICNMLISQIKPLVSPDAVVLFPPVLGEESSSMVLENLATGLSCPVYEVANIPPALPGQRLQQKLLQHLKRRGVEVIIGCTVVNANICNNKCSEVVVEGTGKFMGISAANFILATGSFLGGGLTSKPNEVKENIFNLPVKTTRDKWSAGDFLSMEGQPFSKFGLLVNEFLQPVDEQGQVILENVLVAGANLAGCNYPIEKCGSGVALSTGYKAGKLVGGR